MDIISTPRSEAATCILSLEYQCCDCTEIRMIEGKCHSIYYTQKNRRKKSRQFRAIYRLNHSLIFINLCVRQAKLGISLYNIKFSQFFISNQICHKDNLLKIIWTLSMIFLCVYKHKKRFLSPLNVFAV